MCCGVVRYGMVCRTVNSSKCAQFGAPEGSSKARCQALHPSHSGSLLYNSTAPAPSDSQYVFQVAHVCMCACLYRHLCISISPLHKKIMGFVFKKVQKYIFFLIFAIVIKIA